MPMQNTLRYPRRCQCKYAQQDREFEAELGNNGKVNLSYFLCMQKRCATQCGIEPEPVKYTHQLGNAQFQGDISIKIR